MKIHVIHEQGRLHPDDLRQIELIVSRAIKKEMREVMAQIDDLLSDLNAITTDVADEVAAHVQEVQQLESTITDLQAQVAANQPVDLGPALALTTALRQKLETTASTAANASDSAQAAVDASAQPAG